MHGQLSQLVFGSGSRAFTSASLRSRGWFVEPDVSGHVPSGRYTHTSGRAAKAVSSAATANELAEMNETRNTTGRRAETSRWSAGGGVAAAPCADDCWLSLQGAGIALAVGALGRLSADWSRPASKRARWKTSMPRETSWIGMSVRKRGAGRPGERGEEVAAREELGGELEKGRAQLDDQCAKRERWRCPADEGS